MRRVCEYCNNPFSVPDGYSFRVELQGVSVTTWRVKPGEDLPDFTSAENEILHSCKMRKDK